VVANDLDQRRFEGVVCVGVNELSHHRHHRYLPTIAATGATAWCAPGRNSGTLPALFDQLGRGPRGRSGRSRST
jgi:hypothetical protein